MTSSHPFQKRLNTSSHNSFPMKEKNNLISPKGYFILLKQLFNTSKKVFLASALFILISLTVLATPTLPLTYDTVGDVARLPHNLTFDGSTITSNFSGSCGNNCYDGDGNYQSSSGSTTFQYVHKLFNASEGSWSTEFMFRGVSLNTGEEAIVIYAGNISAPRVQFMRGNGSGDAYIRTDSGDYCNKNLFNSTWMNLKYTFHNNNSLDFFIDGQYECTATGTDFGDMGFFTFPGYDGFAGNFKMDNLTFYNGTQYPADGVSNIPPSITIDSPTEGESFTNIPIPVNYSASDTDGTVDTVTLYVNGTSNQSNANTGSFLLNVSEGVYQLIAEAEDDGGAKTNSTAVTFTLGSLPTIDAINCEYLASFSPCTGLSFGDTLTRVQVDCMGGDTAYATLNNVSSNVFNNQSGTKNMTLFTHDNADHELSTIGTWNVTANCKNTFGEDDSSVQFTLSCTQDVSCTSFAGCNATTGINVCLTAEDANSCNQPIDPNDYNSTSCTNYVATYAVADIDDIVIDGVGTYFGAFVALAGFIAIVVLGVWVGLKLKAIRRKS